MTKVRAALIVFMIVTLAACGASEEQAVNDVLFMSTPSGVVSMKARGGPPAFRSFASVPSGDWSTVVSTSRDRAGNTTDVIGADPSSGEELWRRTVPGRLRAKVVSPQGAYVALVPDGPNYYARPGVTRITVSGRDVEKPTTIRLDGNFEPEAFSTDGKVLFVVQYLPAGKPTLYQVRQLDISEGEVADVFSVDKELQEAMRGTARVQEMSSDGSRLYTLYSTKTRHGEHSFIHVLSLDELWAHCIDLPHGFAMGGESKTALTLNRNGDRLYVADTTLGGVAEVDTERLQVLRETEIEELAGSTGATLVVDEAGDALHVATGTTVGTIDLEELEWQREWKMPGRIRGLQIGDASGRLYVGLRDKVGVIELDSGDVLEPIDPPVESITRLGPVTPGLDPAREKFSCAC